LQVFETFEHEFRGISSEFANFECSRINDYFESIAFNLKAPCFSLLFCFPFVIRNAGNDKNLYLSREYEMKSSLITKLLAAAPVVFMATAMAGVTPNLLDAQGNAVRDGSGACVQELNSVDHPDCVAKKVEPPKPVEPPAPVPPPAPVTPPPAPPAPVAVKQSITIQAEALFDFDKSVVKPAGKKSIDEAIAKMKQLDVEVIIATGHTDSRGTDAYNQKLSERRATAVKNYMVSQGIPAAKISTLGKGETQPVATNKTDAGRAKNRRVDIEFKGVSNK
jgi:OmpA-OmpF porin, OOP family